jgi:hypothetical protein
VGGVRYGHSVLTKIERFLMLYKDKLLKQFFLKPVILFLVSCFEHEEYAHLNIPRNILIFETYRHPLYNML